MKPVTFKQQNITFTRPPSMTDEQCQPLPAFRGEDRLISCWQMNFKDRLRTLITGRVWLSIHGTAQPPVWVGAESPFVK